MVKRLLICFSLLFGLCMSMQAYPTERVQKERASRERVSKPGRRLPAIQNGRERSDGGNTIARGLILTESNAFLSPLKSQVRKLPMIPEGTVTTTNIYGDKIYPSGTGSKGRGLKRINLDGTLYNVMTSDMRVYYKCFGMKENMLYAFMWQKDDYGDICAAWFRSLNLWTLDYTDEDMSETFEDTFIQSGVYVPEENAFYGFGYQCWLKFDVATMTTTKLASPAAGDFNPQMTYNTKLRKIVGITSTGEIYSYSKEDGAQTLLKATGVTSPYTAGFCYDAMSNHYIWNPNTDSLSELVAFNADTYEAYKICDVEDAAQIAVMYCNEAKRKDIEAPRVPEYISSSFKNGAYTGTIEFKLPTLCNNDTPIESAMDYKLFIDGIEYTSGIGNAGENVVLNIGEDANLKDGIVGFNLVCSIGSHESLDNNVGIYVGNDIPLKPKNVKLTIDEISWDPVVAGEHDGYLDTNSVRYNVELNGKLIAEGISTTSCATGLAANAELSSYTATVYATAKGHISEGGTSNDITFGQAFSEPAYFQPTKAQSKLFVIEDANNDWSTWKYHETTGAYRYSFDWDNDGDDWLFLPPVNITETGYLHTFSLNAWAVDEELFEVYVGREPSSQAMTQMVIGESATPGNEEKATYEGMFNAEEPGLYYIGIHAITPADRLYLYVRDMRVDISPVSKNGPDAVEDVTAIPAEKGGLSATITFKMPVTTINNHPLSGTVTAVITNEVDSETVSGAPGSTQSVELNTIQGNNHFTIQTFQGETHGMIYEFDTYTGIDLPGAPENLVAVLNEDNISGTLRWEAPSTGLNGNYISQTGITYYLCQKTFTPFGTYEWNIVNEIGTDVFESKFTVDPETAQQSMSLGVAAANVAGIGNMIAIADFTIGVPYELPASETFKGTNGTVYGPVFLSSKGESKVNWSIGDPAQQGEQYAVADGGAVIGTTATDTYGCITLPKFSTLEMQEAGFMPTFYLGGCENIKVTAAASGVKETEILDMNNVFGMDYSEGYRRIVVKLPETFQNRGWVEIKVYPYFSTERSIFLMDGYRMKNLIHRDLSAKVADKIRGIVGETMTFKATVQNIGISECVFTGGKFTLSDNQGKVIAEKTLESQMNIPADESTEVYWDYVPASKDMGECFITFELNSSDMNESNDIDIAACDIIKGKAVLIEDLTAKAGTDEITLNWTAPEVRNGSESFEDYLPFIPSGSRIGEFTHIYDDNIDAYALKGTSDADKVLKDVMYKTGFHVYNSNTMNALFGRGAVPYATDGEQLLIAFCPGKQTDGNIPSANDWLISPLVKGGTTFSLSACPLINKYGMEQLEICYSTEDTVDPSGFQMLERVEIGNADTDLPVEWQEVSVTLPEDAQRVAIHYVSRDIFGICVDNVNYTPINGNLSVTGYEVYRAEGSATEFSKLGEGTDCTYSDKTASMNIANRYYVLPLLSDGSRGAESNIATVSPSGVDEIGVSRFIAGGNNEIIVCGYDGLVADVHTVDGKTIARTKCSDMTRIEVLPGVYIVSINGIAAKINVR